MEPRLFSVALACVFTLAVTSARAATLFDMTAGNTVFDPSAGWLIKDYSSWPDSTQFVAMSFSLNSDATVTGADLALTSLASWSRNYSIQILADNGGLPSSTVLGEFTGLDRPPVSQAGGVYNFTSVFGASIELQGQTDYWLYMFCYADCQLNWWRDESNPAIGANQVTSVFPNDLRWQSSLNPSAMFRITGDPVVVPLPSAIWLFSSGLLGLIGISKHKNVT